MELTDDEKIFLKFLLNAKLGELKGQEVGRDAPLDFLKAEKEYEEFLNNLLKKFGN
ncbi:hypothetical protein GF323_00175 [Candidatus Woesearchaeota archaeon]|nr:hypothetical protein [Candidatus Woesearchaeota archaeon]